MKNEVLLETLSRMGSSGRAESESAERFCRMFYPPKEQIGALDPDVTLVLGPRGSGKTALFRALTQFELSGTLSDLNQKARILPHCDWHAVELFTDKMFPNQTQLRTFFETGRLTEDQGHNFWQGLLIRSLWPKLDPRAKKELARLHNAESTTDAIMEVSNALANEASGALDRLDNSLEVDGRLLFIGFDELDLLVHRNGRAAATLVSFWASRWRRWKGIRAKLFLRSDIYRRFVGEGGADLAKLSANRFMLKWSDESLMAMLVKRILNTDFPAWKRFLHILKRDVVENQLLGVSLISEKPSDLYRVVHAILGPYMGANRKKGASEKWILEHIKDCQGNASPRSLVRMFESAADLQMAQPNNAQTNIIVDPAFIRQALTRVSNDHVSASVDEWPWLLGLQERLSKWTTIRQMPMDRKLFEGQLKKTWEQGWSKNPELATPPCEDYLGFVPLLIDVGILRERKDGKLETTDLYLDGLGFKRKGGIRRRILKSKE